MCVWSHNNTTSFFGGGVNNCAGHTKASERILKHVVQKEYIVRASDSGINYIYKSYRNLHSGPSSPECTTMDSHYNTFLGHVDYFVEQPLSKVEEYGNTILAGLSEAKDMETTLGRMADIIMVLEVPLPV